MMPVALEFYNFAPDILLLSIAKDERNDAAFASNNIKSILTLIVLMWRIG